MKKDKDINYNKLNETLTLASKLLKIFYIVVIVGIIFLTTLVFKEWKILDFVLKLLRVCAPFFIGLVIAWLLNPIVNWLEKNGFKRIVGAGLIYLTLVGVIFLVVLTLIPLVNGQLNDLISMIPNIFKGVEEFIGNIFSSLNNLQGIDVTAIENNIFSMLDDIVKNIITNLPNSLVSIITSFFSGIGIFFISLVIGFYLLLNFNSISKHFLNVFPKRHRYELTKLMDKISVQLYNFVQGSLISSLVIFIGCTIAFMAIGLKAPVLFALFCAITNVIPYVGPYIGALPAMIVGFSQGTTVGILVGVMILIIQTIDGNLVVPVVMSKKLKIHPVSIMVGLLVFGYFFGIIGMIIATPTLAVAKELIIFIVSKYNLFDYEDTTRKVYIGRKKDEKKA